MLSGLMRRVRGLAMLHRSLYSDVDAARVDARDLVSAVVSDTSALLPDPALEITSDLTSVLLYPDQAVPLSMWLAEGLTNAVKYVGSDPSGVAFIRVALEVDGADGVALSVENSVGDPFVDGATGAESTGLGTKLMIAFCRQLEGKVDIEETHERFTHTLRFQIQSFQAESEDANAVANQHAV